MMMTCVLLAALAGAADVLMPVDIRNVEVGGEIGRRLDVTVVNNLLVIDLERDFLEPFLKREESGGYIGLGKTIDAMARFCAYSENEQLIARKKKVVDALLASQEADGYLGMFVKSERTTSLWDTHELSYLVLGLTSDYRFCGEQKSLEAARKLADYLVAELGGTPPTTAGGRPNGGGKKVGPDDLSAVMGTTGLDTAMLYLSETTGDAKYRDFVIETRKLAAWRLPIVKGRWGTIEGHAYAYMQECLAQVRLSAYVDDPGLWEETRKVFEFLLNGDGLVITGACGDHECWHDTQSGTTNLGETCATAYLARLCDEVLRKTGNTLYGDVMERSIYNALFAAQSPDGRRLRYYAPLEAARQYFDGDTYCCPCNYRRIVAELPQMIYYGRADGVYVNQFAPSTATVRFGEGREVKLKQETDYPNSGRVVLTVESGGEAFMLYVRQPRWAKSAALRVNGEMVERGADEKPGMLAVKRNWKAGDRIEIDFPMEWRLVKGRKAQVGRVAVMRGPQVFTYNPARNRDMKDLEPRLFTMDENAAVEGPFPDDSVRPGGMACKVRMWEPGAWYPRTGSREIVLTEFGDPDARWTYFLVSNPEAERLVEDELVGAWK